MTQSQNMDNQRIRNLTTKRLHTKMEDIYEDIEFMVGEKGIMTHMLPRAATALEPFLRQRATDPRFWDGTYDTTHTGSTEMAALTTDEKKTFFEAYMKLPSPFDA